MPRPKKQILKQRKDGRYCAVYKGIQFMGSTSDEALALRQAYKDREKAGAGKVTTVSKYAVAWLPIAYPAVSATTYRGLATHLEHLVEMIGHKTIDSVTPTDIRAVYSVKYKDASNSYIKKSKQIYCRMFDSAVADGYCRSNPARFPEAKPHKGKPVRKRKLTPQQRTWIETLCTDHRAYPVAMAMLYAGLRPPEAKALKIERDVDFENNTITLQSFAHVDGSKYDFTETGKTNLSSRTIPLFPPLRKVLKGRKGYLIATASGEQVTIQAWRRVWESYRSCMETAINGMPKRWYRRTKEHKKILAEAEAFRIAGNEDAAKAKESEIPDWIEFNITPYTLRTAFCRFCRDNKVELNVCRRWMGHSDATMILQVYDEASDNRSDLEVERLNKDVFHMQNNMQIKINDP